MFCRSKSPRMHRRPWRWSFRVSDEKRKPEGPQQRNCCVFDFFVVVCCFAGFLFGCLLYDTFLLGLKNLSYNFTHFPGWLAWRGGPSSSRWPEQSESPEQEQHQIIYIYIFQEQPVLVFNETNYFSHMTTVFFSLNQRKSKHLPASGDHLAVAEDAQWRVPFRVVKFRPKSTGSFWRNIFLTLKPSVGRARWLRETMNSAHAFGHLNMGGGPQYYGRASLLTWQQKVFSLNLMGAILKWKPCTPSRVKGQQGGV